MNKLIAVSCVLVLVVSVIVALALPGTGVTPTLLARGTYEAFKVKSSPTALFEFEAEAKPAVDLVVRKHDYLPGGTTGWHMHPGPVFITVTEGTVTFYEFDDPDCTPTIVSAGQGYVDTGRGHIGRNETNYPAKDVSVIVAPVGVGFRSELPATSPNCGF